MIIFVFDTPSCPSQVVWRRCRTERAPSDFSENFSDMFFCICNHFVYLALLYPLGPAFQPFNVGGVMYIFAVC